MLIATAAAIFGVADASSAAGGWDSITPTPVADMSLPVRPCGPVLGQIYLEVCVFGAPSEQATATIALVGDSHAAHWRGALTEVARAKGWLGYSMAHSSCPLQLALRDLPEPRRTLCATWKSEVFAWFTQHPEIHTVFVAGLTGGTGVVATKGRSRFATSEAGYADAWRALFPSVTRVFVIRDTPKEHISTASCVERAMARHRDAAVACAVPRRLALDRDPAIAAAASMPASEAQSLDLTRYFCGRSVCYPVVGGVRVLRDETHMTNAFSTTLGPYLLKAVDAALARFSEAGRSNTPVATTA